MATNEGVTNTERYIADADSQNISEPPIPARILFLLNILSVLMTRPEHGITLMIQKRLGKLREILETG